MLNLKTFLNNYEGAARTFSELSPWMALVADDTVLCKDGSLLTCYSITGIDIEGRDGFEVDQTALRIESAIRAFNEQATIWWTVDRRHCKPFPKAEYPNMGSAYMASVWEEHLESTPKYENQHWLAVLHTPAGGIDGFLDNVKYFSVTERMSLLRSVVEAIRVAFLKKQAFAQVAAKIDIELQAFKEILMRFESGIVEYGARRLTGMELITYLHRRCCPANEDQVVNPPRLPMYMDSYLADNELVIKADMIEARQNKVRHIGVLSVKDWPDMTSTGLFDSLLSIPGELTISQVFRFTEQGETQKYLETTRRHNLNMQKPLMAYVKEALTKEPSSQVNEGRMLLADDAQQALTELTMGVNTFGYYNMSILAYGETEDVAQNTLDNINIILGASGTISIRERLHMLSAFAGTMPGQWAEIVRWTFVSTGNVADICPVRCISTGSRKAKFLSEQTGKDLAAVAVLPTAWNTPYYFNFHVGDVGHTFVIGPTGGGKTVFVNLLIAMFQKYDPYTIIFDKDYSAQVATLIQDGEHIDMLGEGGQRISLNPMLLVGDKENWNWLKEWLEILITSRGYEMTADDDKNLWSAIEMIAAMPKESWRLQSLPSVLHSRLATQLQAWMGDGQFARFFDNEEDSFHLGRFTTIEMGGMFQNETLARAFMEYAFFQINQRLDGTPTIIYVEEAWFMLSDTKFAFKVMDWLKTLRKKNAIVILTTQSLDDISRSDIFSTIIDNMPMRIFLPNANARAHAELYASKFGLNEAQINQIQTGQPKEDYYIVTPETNRMVKLRLPAQLLGCLRADPKARQVFMKHRDQGADGWQKDYLDEIVAPA